MFGLGGWFLGALLVLRFWPSRPLDDQLLAVVSIAVPIWLGVYAGWVRTDTPKAMKMEEVVTMVFHSAVRAISHERK